MTINMILLERDANKLFLTNTNTSGWNVNSFDGLLLLFFVAVDIFINL